MNWGVSLAVKHLYEVEDHDPPGTAQCVVQEIDHKHTNLEDDNNLYMVNGMEWNEWYGGGGKW